MKQDVIISLAVHFLFLATALVSSPFEPNNQIDYGEIIRVTLPSADQFQSAPTEVIPEPMPVPEPTKVEEPEVPIEEPSTEEVIEVPEPEDEPEKETRKVPLPEDATDGSNDTDGNAESEVDVEATAQGGTVLSGATVDNSNFNYPYWFTQAFYKISATFRNPVNYDGTLRCVVHFEVMQSGRVYGLKVIESSGLPQYDQACLASVQSATPLPPLPREFMPEVIGITLPFNWKPR